MAIFEGERSDYGFGTLERKDLFDDPFRQFKFWLDSAIAHNIPEPSAMCLSTVSEQLQPSSRFVLLRGIDHGFIFYTNYLSRKGNELESNPHACLNFWWATLERQIRIEGMVEKLAPTESDAYFNSRPFESQIASASSPQSQRITSRNELEEKVQEIRRSGEENLVRPKHWGGYRLIPSYFEFWQGRSARLHDRFEYNLRKEGNPGKSTSEKTNNPTAWEINRLAP